MLLVVDVGNSETTLGLCDGERVVEHWRVTTDAARTPDEVFLLLRSLILSADLVPAAVTGLMAPARMNGVVMQAWLARA